MSNIDPSLLNSIFSVTYKYAPDPGDTVSYTRALINIKNVNSLTVDTLTYSNIDFGDASGNLFVGDRAGCNSSLVSNCTGIGEESMDYLTGGSNVDGFGFSSLRDTASLTRVVAIGTYAGDSNSNVADTVIVGSLAARNLSGASSNVIIGSGAGASLTGGSNNIFIGAGVDPVVGLGNNIINIANTISGTVGGTLSMTSVYANGFRTLGGGGNLGFTVIDPSGNQQFRLQWLGPAVSPRSIIQTNAPLYFNQVGTAQGNTYLNISGYPTDDDLLNVGGSVNVVRNLTVSGTISAASLSVFGTISAASILAANLSVGNTVSASTFVGNGTVPVGGIIMWSGSLASIPAGWALCDGTNGTPNLTNRFVIAAGGTYAVGSNGGSTTQTLAVSNIPPHTHSGYVGPLDAINSGGNATQNAPAWGGGSDTNGASITASTTISSAIYNPAGTLVLSGGDTPASFSILPPYYALAYIMRTV